MKDLKIVKVSKEEFEKLRKEYEALSDEELDKVAGGHLCPIGCIYADNCCHCTRDWDED